MTTFSEKLALAMPALLTHLVTARIISLTTILSLLTTTSTAAAQPDSGHAASHSYLGGASMSASELLQTTLEWAESEPAFNSDDQRIVISAGKMDNRLTFSRCANPLEFAPQQNNGRSTRTLIKVRCTDEKSWAVFVPLEVQRFQSVIVASNNLLRGTKITRSDLEQQERAINHGANNGFKNPDQLMGMEVKRSLRAGQVISQYDVKKPQLIKRGDNVVIVAETGTISVKMMGTALANGFHGQQIQVRNDSSERTIKAIVIDVGIVQALM